MDFSSSSFTQQDTTDVLQMLIEFHLKQKITIYEQAMTLRATKKINNLFFFPAFTLPSSYGNICCQVSKKVMQNLIILGKISTIWNEIIVS